MSTFQEVLDNQQIKAAEAGFGGLFNAHITSPIALGMLAAPSLYHMATGTEAKPETKDLAEAGGLGLLIHGELPAFVNALRRH